MPGRILAVLTALLVGLGVAAPIAPDPPAPEGPGPAGPEPSRATHAPFPASSSSSTTTSTTLAIAPLPGMAAALEAELAGLEPLGLSVGMAVWVDGVGPVFSAEPERPLLPASNQKLLTATGAYLLLPPDERFVTEVVGAVEPTEGVLGGDLVLVAGGDPTLAAAHLGQLAEQVRAAGVRAVEGDLVIDAGRYVPDRAAPGWQRWHIPTYAGPLSAFMVDDNRHRSDPGYLTAPDLGNGAVLADALAGAGVELRGILRAGEAPADGWSSLATPRPPSPSWRRSCCDGATTRWPSRSSARSGGGGPARGRRRRGWTGCDEPSRGWGCGWPVGTGDGSGLSRWNWRSAGEWVELLRAASREPWFPRLLDALPVAGETGTLRGRLLAEPTAGNVRAKTGSIIGGRALSGYLTDSEGRRVVFSMIVNGPRAGEAVPVIDRLVTILAEWPGE